MMKLRCFDNFRTPHCSNFIQDFFFLLFVYSVVFWHSVNHFKPSLPLLKQQQLLKVTLDMEKELCK